MTRSPYQFGYFSVSIVTLLLLGVIAAINWYADHRSSAIHMICLAGIGMISAIQLMVSTKQQKTCTRTDVRSGDRHQ
jgi:hypothetical protein